MKETASTIAKLLSISTFVGLCLFSFSFETRQKIWHRDEGKCRRCSKSKKKGYYLEVSHLNHDRNYPYYDSPSNGILVCLADHLQEHRKMKGRNGLSPEGNEEAIRKIQERMREKQRAGIKI